jgi:hypothetical protein
MQASQDGWRKWLARIIIGLNGDSDKKQLLFSLVGR